MFSDDMLEKITLQKEQYAVRCKPLRRQRRQLPYKGSLNNELKFIEITPN